jgi:hypothetical protein
MPLAELNDLRRGFHRTFWIANTLELSGIGLASTAAMLIYNAVVARPTRQG